MRGTIAKIHEKKIGRNGNVFVRCEFQMDDGSWAATDLCPAFRNFSRWSDLLIVGNVLDGLEMKSTSKVNADSFPTIWHGQN